MSDQQTQGGTGTRGDEAGAPIASEAPGESPSSDLGSRAVADSADRRDVSETSRDDVAAESERASGSGARDDEASSADATANSQDRSDDLERTESAGNSPDSTTARDADTADERADDHTDDRKDEQRQQDDEERRREEDAKREQMQEEFAREHDPEQHDVSAGEEFRQEGDWTADDAGGAQVWDAEGNLVEGSSPGVTRVSGESAQSGQQGSGDTAPGGRTSSLDEIRDGGYGVGSAATLDDGATPLGHPVKAWEDTKTYVAPEHGKYGEADPHLWFTDAEAAERAGFTAVD